MGSLELRRVDTADRITRLLATGSLTLLLLTATSGAADEAEGDLAVPPPAGAPEETRPAPPGDDAEAEAPDDVPVRSVGPVTVTATRAERDVLDVAGNVSVLDREAIERSGARTVPELLRRQTGLFVTNTTTNRAGTTVDGRGFNNGGGNGGNLLVQIDGRRVNEADLGTPDWALIPLENVESIEIVRGSASAIYGDNSTAGVVNIRTIPREGPPRATLQGTFGRYDTGAGSLLAAGSWGRANGSFFASGADTDGYRANSEFDAQDYDGSLEWSFANRVRVGARGGYHEDFREFPGALTRSRLQALGRRAANPNSLADESKVHRGFVQGWLETVLADDVSLQVRPFYRKLRNDATITASFFGLETTTVIDAEKPSAGVDTQLQVDRELFGRPNRFIAGFEYLHDEIDREVDDPFFPNTSKNERQVYAFFLQEEIEACDDVLLTAGIRYDRADLDLDVYRPLDDLRLRDKPDYQEWSPKASITWRVLPLLSLYGSYTRGFRLPTLDEASPLFGSIPGLEAQVSDTGEIGAKLASARFQGALALYWMNVRNEILFDPIFFTNENLDQVRHRGIEVALAVQILSWLSAYGNYTFDDVKILEAADPLVQGTRMPISPRHRGTLGVLATLPWDLEVAANLNVVGERARANDFDRQVVSLRRYATLDLLFGWRPELGEHLAGALTFALRNVTAEKYEGFGARDDFDPDTGAFAPTAFFYPAAKRTYEIGASITVRR